MLISDGKKEINGNNEVWNTFSGDIILKSSAKCGMLLLTYEAMLYYRLDYSGYVSFRLGKVMLGQVT